MPRISSPWVNASAKRFSGARPGAVVTGDQYLGTICEDWTYQGEG